MKQTPFYEISVALKGRSKLFSLMVICSLSFSFLVIASFFSNQLPKEETSKAAAAVKQQKGKSPLLLTTTQLNSKR